MEIFAKNTAVIIAVAAVAAALLGIGIVSAEASYPFECICDWDRVCSGWC